MRVKFQQNFKSLTEVFLLVNTLNLCDQLEPIVQSVWENISIVWSPIEMTGFHL